MSDLDKLDLSKLTLDDIRGVKNDSLRHALENALHLFQNQDDPPTSHQNHHSHSNHNTSLPAPAK